MKIYHLSFQQLTFVRKMIQGRYRNLLRMEENGHCPKGQFRVDTRNSGDTIILHKLASPSELRRHQEAVYLELPAIFRP